jgi:Ca-activated chloride channel family protein
MKTDQRGEFSWNSPGIALRAILALTAVAFVAQSDYESFASQSPTSASSQTKPPQRPNPPQPSAPPQEKEESFKISSNLVAVPVSVTDADGQPIRNLSAQDFQLEEEGKSQQLVSLGQPGKTPVELALLFDTSVSVKGRFQFEQQAGSRFLKEVLRPNDTASVLTIGTKPGVIQTRVASVDKAIAALLAINPTKQATAFFDTVVEASLYLSKSAEPGSRRVIVVISDGEDTSSENYKLAEAMKELQRTDCLFYAINPSGPSIRLNKISLKGHDGMVQLAGATGGAAFLPDVVADLDKVFRQITAELQAQYLLGYYSSDERTDGGFRRITVRVQKRPDIRVRARQGYYAPRA